MLVNRISRVPIIDGSDPHAGKGGRKCRGIVRMRKFFDRDVAAPPPVSLAELMSEPPPEVGVGDSLFAAVEKLRGKPELLVRDANGLLTWILTPRGLADWWAAYSEPFLVVEELETALRDMLRPFEGDKLQLAVDVRRVEELNPSDYREAFTKFRSELHALGGLDEDVIRQVLISFAEQRNKLMHFRLDDRTSLTPDLRRFRELQERIRKVVPSD
jgi:hypothetical protein